MRVLHVSKFAHHVGGVETYLAWAVRTLIADGHEVGVLAMTPPPGEELMDLAGAPVWLTPTRSYAKGAKDRVRDAAQSIWSPEAGRTMKRALEEFRPDVVHFHGTCYQLTPAVVRATADAGIACVLTAHEYKLMCPQQSLFIEHTSQVCMACVGASRIQRTIAPVKQGCMKESRAVSLVGATEQLISTPTWKRANPKIIAPSKFMRDLLVRDGWSKDRVSYLDLAWRDAAEHIEPSPGVRDSLVFVGRVAPAKGPLLLLEAWRRIADRHPDITLRILGTGSQEELVKDRIVKESIPRVVLEGWANPDQVRTALDRAVVTAHPSQNPDNSPYTVRESLMAGVPALVSDVGGMPDMVNSATGWVVPRDDIAAWSETLDRALVAGLAGSPELVAAATCRSMTTQDHLKVLLQVYDESRLERAQA